MDYILYPILCTVGFILLISIRQISEYERGIKFKFGKFKKIMKTETFQRQIQKFNEQYKKYKENKIYEEYKRFFKNIKEFEYNGEKISILECQKYDKIPTEDEIINFVGGHDLTDGSCTSVALAYIGNKIGLKVLDFRDGASKMFFFSKY